MTDRVMREIEKIRTDVALWISRPAALDPLSYQLCVDAAALVEEFANATAQRDTARSYAEDLVRLNNEHMRELSGLRAEVAALQAQLATAKVDALTEAADEAERMPWAEAKTIAFWLRHRGNPSMRPEPAGTRALGGAAALGRTETESDDKPKEIQDGN